MTLTGFCSCIRSELVSTSAEVHRLINFSRLNQHQGSITVVPGDHSEFKQHGTYSLKGKTGIPHFNYQNYTLPKLPAVTDLLP